MDDVLKEFGITNEQLLEYDKKMEQLFKHTHPTQKMRLVDRSMNLLNRMIERHEKVGAPATIELEYRDSAAAITVKEKDSQFYSGKSLECLKEVISYAETVTIEIDIDNPKIINTTFVITDVREPSQEPVN